MELLLALTMLPVAERKLLIMSDVVGVQCVPNLYGAQGHATQADFGGKEVPRLDLGVPGEECTHSMADLRSHWDHAPHWRADLDSGHVRHLGRFLDYCQRLTDAVVQSLRPKDAVVSVLGGRVPMNTTFTTGVDQLGEIAYAGGVITYKTGNTMNITIRLLDEPASSLLTKRHWTQLGEVLDMQQMRLEALAGELREAVLRRTTDPEDD